jgi:uncharacterized membrane protein YozB (DUF420 family)
LAALLGSLLGIYFSVESLNSILETIVPIINAKIKVENNTVPKIKLLPLLFLISYLVYFMISPHTTYRL